MEDDASLSGDEVAASNEAFFSALESEVASAAVRRAFNDYTAARIRYAEAMRPVREAFLAGLRAGPPSADADVPPAAPE